MSLYLFMALSLAAGQAAAPKKVEIVSVTGCLREQGANNWMVVAATEPVPSVANQAPPDEIPKTPPDGKNAFKLIGVGEFGLPTLRDRTVVVQRAVHQGRAGQPDQHDVDRRSRRNLRSKRAKVG